MLMTTSIKMMVFGQQIVEHVSYLSIQNDANSRLDLNTTAGAKETRKCPFVGIMCLGFVHIHSFSYFINKTKYN